MSRRATFSLRAALTAGALALLATAALAITSPPSAVACGSLGYQIGTSYGWSEGHIYVSGYYVYSSGRSCPEEYLDRELPPEEPPPPSACDLDPDSRACARERLYGDVANALRSSDCNWLLTSIGTNAQGLFDHLIAQGRIFDGGVPTGDRAGATSSALPHVGVGYQGNITLWDAFYDTRPPLFPNEVGTQPERRANIVLEELGHLTGQIGSGHNWYGSSNQQAWSALIRQRCQPSASQSGVAAAQQ